MPTPKDWENPRVIGRNKEPGHVPLGAYPDVETALTCDPTASPNVRRLNGRWRFHLAPGPTEVPVGFYEEGFDATGWGEIDVPGNWQLPIHWEGLGSGAARIQDRPIYLNVHYPYEADPPRVPEANPTGCYRTSFELDVDTDARDVFLLFESVDAACYVWVNGRKVGYSQGSRLPAEFDITPYVQQGSNLLAVEVLRYCDGTYMEDQDMWRMSGIQRDVLLITKPKVALRDFAVRTSFDDPYEDATLTVDACLGRDWRSLPGDAGDYVVSARLCDAAGRPVFDGPVSANFRTKASYRAQPNTGCARITAEVTAPHHWTAETPYLDYGALDAPLTLKSAEGDLAGVTTAERWADEIVTTTARVLATYDQGWLAGLPAITVNDYGEGKVVYVGTLLRGFSLDAFITWLSAVAGVSPILATPDGVRAYERRSDTERLLFLLNFGDRYAAVQLDTEWTDVFSNEAKKDVTLSPADVRILRKEESSS